MPRSPSDATRARRERDALLALARDMASGAPSTRRVLRHLASTAQAFTSAEGACVLALRDDVYHVVGPTGITTPYDDQRIAMMPPPSVFREVLATRQVVWTNDGQTDPRVDPRFKHALGIRHLATAPIIVDDRIEGLLLVINSAQPDGFSAEDAAFLGRLAEFSAVALRDAELVQRADDAASAAQHEARLADAAARRSAVLARVASALASAESADAVYRQLFEVARELLAAGGLGVWEADAESRTVRLRFQSGAGAVDPTRVAEFFWVMRTGDVVRNRTPLLVSDLVDGSPAEMALTENMRREGIRSLAILPLLVDGRCIGTMALRFTERWAFDDDERRFLDAVGALVSQALRNSQHRDELAARAQRLANLATAQQRLAGVRSLDALPAAMLEAVRLVVPQATSTDIREVLDSHHAEAGAHVHERDATIELCLPLADGDRPTRRLCVRTAEARGFDPQDVDLLRILARHAMQALETARVIEAQAAERRHVEAAGEIARVALDARSLTQGAEGILAVIDGLAPNDGMALGIARSRDGRLEYAIATGLLGSLQGYRPPGTRGVLGLSPTGEAVIVPSLRAEAPEPLRAQVPDVPVLVLPLLARDHAVGALLLASTTQPPFPPSVRETLTRLATSLALAIDANLLDEEERQARQREQMLATALMTLDHPVFILDGERIRYANPSASREYGYPAAELVGREFRELVVTTSPDTPWSVLSAGAVPTSPEMPEPAHVHRRRDGTEFPAAVAINPLRDEGQRLTGAVVSVRDLTADRALAEQLRHSEKMVALGELVAGVAHEINNPLTGISAFAELLLDETLPADQRESVELIKRESERATAVIRDLLLFARKGETPLGPVDLNALVAQTLRLRGYALRSAGIEVRTELEPALPSVPGDGHKLHQVLLNLVSNAEYALAPARMGGRETRVLTVRTSAHEGQVRVEVADTGCGMSTTVKRRLFEPFFTTKPPGVGTGLGLSVSYGIAQAHGGTLTVESEEGEGTQVTLVVPTALGVPREPEPARLRFTSEASGS